MAANQGVTKAVASFYQDDSATVFLDLSYDVRPDIIESLRPEFTANLLPLEVTWQVFHATFEVYDVRFQRGVGFHVCHLPESF